jgi:hypothetical protein
MLWMAPFRIFVFKMNKFLLTMAWKTKSWLEGCRKPSGTPFFRALMLVDVCPRDRLQADFRSTIQINVPEWF